MARLRADWIPAYAGMTAGYASGAEHAWMSPLRLSTSPAYAGEVEGEAPPLHAAGQNQRLRLRGGSFRISSDHT